MSTQINDFLFLFLNWIKSFRIQLRKNSPTFDGSVEQYRINPTKFEPAQWHFRSSDNDDDDDDTNDNNNNNNNNNNN